MRKLPLLLLSLLAIADGVALREPAHAAVAGQGSGCAGLGGLSAAGLKLTATEITPAPVWRAPHQPSYNGEARTPFCRVEGVIEGRIGFELWLPKADAWNGRLLGAGVGGDAGVFNYADLGRTVAAGFAAVTTDSGHKVSDRTWMMNPVAVEDYSQRAQHVTAEAAKRLVAAYYGRPAHHAYFLGCSGGGRQAMKAAQAFPDDYDGLIAGASAPSMPELSARHLWEGLYQQRHPEGALTDADWALVSNAAVIACDKLDGVADGVVEDPRRCRWEAGWLLCRSAKGPQCLTAEQVATVRAIYTPFRDDTGRLLDHGVLPGVRTRPGPPSPLLLTMFAQGAHHDPNWRAEQFRIAADLALANQQMPHLRADSLDLDRLSRRGGKLIMYQGWMDPSVLAEQSLAYFEALSQRYRRSVDSFARLYMVPGMLHCRGGEGADEFGGATAALPYGDPDHDLLAALVRWVEQGRSPGPITASKLVEGRVVRQHPLCPYPQTARYLGGNPDHAATYRCEASAAARRSRRRSDEFGQGAGDPRRGRAHAAGRAPVALAAALAGLQRWTNGKAPQPGPTVEELLARTERFELAREPKPTRFPEIGAPSVPLRSTAA